MSNTYQLKSERWRKTLAVVFAGALLGALLPLTTASPADAAPRDDDIADACEGAPEATFNDEDEFTAEQEEAADCIAADAWNSIYEGDDAGNFNPGDPITREQMASVIARFMEAMGHTFAADPVNAFPDDDTSAHHLRINQIAAANVVGGRACGVAEGGAHEDDQCYFPKEEVRRDQMAKFIREAITQALGVELTPTDPEEFAGQCDTTLEDDVEALAEANIVQGLATPDPADPSPNYGCDNPVTRGQVALFAARGLDWGVENNEIENPFGPAAQALPVPELVSASVGESRSAGTQLVLYTFDEDVNATALNPSLFHIYDFDGSVANGTAAQMQSGSTKTVEVQFTTAQVAEATVATVDRGAVQDSDGNLNAIGAAGLEQVVFGSGETEAPDLTAAAIAAGANGSGDEVVAFDFDETVAAAPITGNAFFVVYQDGTVDQSTTATRDTSDTSIVNAVFNITSAEAAQGARACVQSGAVQDGEGNQNEQQCADLGNAGNTTDPDLLSASKDSSARTVTLVFDEAINTYNALTDFQIYDVDGNENNPSDITVSGNQVTLIFKGSATNPVQDDVTGVSIDDNAVTDANDGTQSEIDEVGISGATYTVAAGNTTGPDLVSVTATAIKNAFGTITGYNVDYKFDEAITTAITCTDFYIWSDSPAASGTRTQATACSRQGSDTVRVTSFTKAQVEAAVLGTVDDTAVSDGEGNQNPEGDDAFTESGT